MAKRTERLEIRLTPQEKADLREQADTESMTITELVVRQCLQHPEPLPECDYCGRPAAATWEGCSNCTNIEEDGA